MAIKKRNVCILGAAGRDFHNFLMVYKDNPVYDVKFFTAEQIPGIEKRSFPKKMAGRLYNKDIPIFPERDLPGLLKKYNVDDVVMSYSDLSHETVMHVASLVNACGASMVMLGADDTMLESKKKVISVCAVRTGAGKSQTTRRIAEVLKKAGKKVVAIRHPMPYGDLMKQRCQRFAKYDDFEKHECTIEEREEYEPWVERDIPIYAGVDYEMILRQAEKEADIILWDGGNNDTSFIKADLYVTVVDPHRAGHEVSYYPGETNLRLADVIVINKIGTAPKGGVETVMDNIKRVNPKATVIKAKSKFIIRSGGLMKNRRALVVEDGPTLTHGGMSYGAGFLAAKKYKAKIISPKKFAVGSIADTYKKYRHLKNILPAMGYGAKQIKDLEKTINKSKVQVVVDGSPINLAKLVDTQIPIVRVRYVLHEVGLSLEDVLKKKKFI